MNDQSCKFTEREKERDELKRQLSVEAAEVARLSSVNKQLRDTIISGEDKLNNLILENHNLMVENFELKVEVEKARVAAIKKLADTQDVVDKAEKKLALATKWLNHAKYLTIGATALFLFGLYRVIVSY